MATTDEQRGRSFVDNLGKVYAMYTLGFLAFFALMAILEQLGAGARLIGILFLLFTIAIYAIIGYLSRTMQVDAYYVAGREVPALYNGMATAADWMSGASFVALAGGIYFGGYPYLGLRRRLDRRLRAGQRADGAVPSQVRLLHGARLHRHPLWRQHLPASARFSFCGGIVHLRDRADQRHGHHRLARSAFRSRSASGSASWVSSSARCSAACAV